VKELGFLFVTQFMSLEPSKVITQNGEEWRTLHHPFKACFLFRKLLDYA